MLTVLDNAIFGARVTETEDTSDVFVIRLVYCVHQRGCDSMVDMIQHLMAIPKISTPHDGNLLRSIFQAAHYWENPRSTRVQLSKLFYILPALKEMWQSLWGPWSKVFKRRLEWRLLLFPKLSDLNPDWRQHQNLLVLLWRMHTAVVFHLTWRLRNGILFGEAQTQKASVQNVNAYFRRHCKFLYRHSRELKINGEAVASVLGIEAPTAFNLTSLQLRI